MKNKLAGLTREEIFGYIERFVYGEYRPWPFAGSGGGRSDIEHACRDFMEEMEFEERTFAEELLFLIDKKKKKDSEIYKRAGVDKSVFSKIRKGQEPSKETAVALAVALELPMTKTQDLLGKAGYSLSRSLRNDLIVRAFIAARCYDIDLIRAAIYDKEFCADHPEADRIKSYLHRMPRW